MFAITLSGRAAPLYDFKRDYWYAKSIRVETERARMKLDTLTDIFFNAVQRDSPRTMMFKRNGKWLPLSSNELRHKVLSLARNLHGWGLKRGDRVAILSENRPEWQMADFACLLLGIIDVPIYATQTAPQILYMLQNSGARAIFVSSSAQLEKISSIKAQTALERVVVMDDSDSTENAIAFSSLLTLEPSAEDAEIEATGKSVQPSDVATLIYTSGTTGTPKGAMLTHGNIASNLVFSLSLFQPGTEDVSLSFLPLSHITARHIDYAYLQDGVTLAYCPHIEDLPVALQEIRPTFFVGVPRVYEKVYNRVQQGVRGGLKKQIYEWALQVGAEHIDTVVAGRTPNAISWKIADLLVFRKIKAGFGGRVRAFLSGGAPLGRELATWYAKAGVCIYEGYGLTETSPVIALNTPAANRLGTVGKVLPNVEIKIAEDGELLVRGPNVFKGYWNQPEETKNAFADGWFKTGDIAAADQEGFVSITDRKKDLIKTSGGKFIAPQPLETSLKTNPLVAQAAIIGDRRKFPAVIIAPQFPMLEDWAREQRIPFRSRQELVDHEGVHSLYKSIVESLNEGLAKFERLKKVLLVPDEFSVESGELTPSMKLKRRVVEEKYKAQIDALYAETGAEVPA